MYIDRQTVTIVTDTNGDGTGYANVPFGRVLGIAYVKANSGGYSDGIDFVATVEGTAEALMTGTNVNSSASYYPRVGVSSTAGAALTYDGTHPVVEPVAVCNDRVKIVVASGGSVKTGTFYVLIG